MLVTTILFTFTFLQSIIPPNELPESIAFLLGAFASIVVQFIKGRVENRIGRFVISVLLSIVTAVSAYFIAKPEETDLVVFVIHVFAYSQLAYNTFWKLIWEGMFNLHKFGKYKGE